MWKDTIKFLVKYFLIKHFVFKQAFIFSLAYVYLPFHIKHKWQYTNRNATDISLEIIYKIKYI